MSNTNTLEIDGEQVSIDDPCAMAIALKKVLIRLSTGRQEVSIRIDGEEVTYNSARTAELKGLIQEYEGECRRKSGGHNRTRFAKRFRFY